MVVTLGQLSPHSRAQPSDEGDAIALIRMVLRAQAAAAEHHAAATAARQRGAIEIAELAAEAAAQETRLAERIAQRAGTIGKPKHGRG
jgi:hypothetical protein